MCTLSKKRFARTSPTLVAITAAAAIATTGCGMFSDDDGSTGVHQQGDGEIHEEDHTFRSLHIPRVSTDYAVAVGAKVDIEVSGSVIIDDVEIEDPAVFTVEDIDGDEFTVHALEPGESSFQVFVEEGDHDLSTDTFDLRAEEAESVALEAECSILDLTDHGLAGAAYEGPKVWTTDEIFIGDLRLRGGVDDEYIHGYGYHPFTVDPADELAFGGPAEGSLLLQLEADLASEPGVELITGSQEEEVLIEPTIDGSPTSMPLVHAEHVDDIAIIRYEDSDEDDAYFSHTLPGEEPTLDLVENETYNFLPHRYYDDRIVCEPNLPQSFGGNEDGYRVTSLSPESCKLGRATSSDDPSETISVAGFRIPTLHLESAGECTVEVEYLRGPANHELVEEFTWVVE